MNVLVNFFLNLDILLVIRCEWITDVKVYEEELEKKLYVFLKASVYSRFLDFNFGNCLIQGLSDLLLLLLISNLWGISKSQKLFILYLVCNDNKKILFNKLDWRKLLFYVCESCKKLRFFRCCFMGEFYKRFQRILNVNFVLIFYLITTKKYNNYIKPMCIHSRFFSSVLDQLKDKFNKKSRKFESLFPIICSIENIQEAWYDIKSKSGSMIFDGNQVETLNALDFEWFEKTSEKLMLGFYKYKFAKQVHIEKPSKSGRRTLIIGSPRDKIIQMAIFRVLQFIYEGVSVWESTDYDTFKDFVDPIRPLYGADSKRIKIVNNTRVYEIRKWILEPKFSHFSFGFRPNYSPHSSLKLIKYTWSPVWFQSIELIKAFEGVNKNKLISEIEKMIYDPRLIDELRKMICFKVIKNKFGLRFSQDNILFFFLFNIYLSSLDFYVESLKFKYDKENFLVVNSEYRKRIRVDQKKFVDLNYREKAKWVKFNSDKVVVNDINSRASVRVYLELYVDMFIYIL